MVAVDLAISKETDTFQPHKQTRLYGITMALSQCPEGNSPVLLLFRGWGCHGAVSPHPCLLLVWPLTALITGQGKPSPFHRESSLFTG